MTTPVDAVVQRAEARVGVILKGKYRLERLLGTGGMAAVYRASHRNGSRVAIKMLHLELSLDKEARSRFLLEGYAANNVDHPGVVRVLDDDTADDGSVFVVMELLEGTTLDKLLEQSGGALAPALVMDISHQLTDVLASAHEKGIIHRDLKPENLFLTTGGVLKVLDFGLARVGAMQNAHATQSGQVFGTPAFMPPEQALGRTSEVDHRTDLWAAGATMFTLLSGQLVHEAQSVNEHLIYAASRPARSLASVARGVPRPIVAVVDRALSFAKTDRFPDARAMQRAIDDACIAAFGALPAAAARSALASQPGERPQSAVALSLSDSPTIPRALPAARRRALWIAALLALLAAALGIFGLFASSPDQPLTASSAAPASSPEFRLAPSA